ncbi:hypothetical protein [Clostridium sp. Marseille-P299]|uniref:hypothetical protein n=1 Tax=Clostridium sp. Marseille-P299 TaxID=1805477 RepID=UPI00082DC37C|nr:hypothetical protein [Clostridium sp. Marseille-P299]
MKWGVPMEADINTKESNINMEESNMNTIGSNINTKTGKKKKNQYIKGLLIRIIICCTIFLILFTMDMAKVEILDYDTQKIITMIEDNSIVNYIEEVISNFIKE